jgi:tetratricopeptide (TPR) repeat protein
VRDTSVLEAVRGISEDPPRPLAQVWRGVRKLDPDLETIVGKALEKDRERRYGSAAELATDIERFLLDQPVLASPPSRTHRAAKFARRHKMGVGAATAGLMMLLVFAVTMTVQAARIARERDQTRLEAATANQALDFLTGLFEVSNPSEARGNSITAREILDKGAAEIEESLADQPVAQARLMSTMGEVYLGLGLYSEAEPLLTRSAEIRRRELGGDHPDTLESINKVGAVFHYQGKLDEAEAHLREALETRRRVLGEDDPATLMSINNMAALIQQRGKLDEAESYRREAMEGYRRVLGDDHEWTLAAINNMGYLLYAQGKLDEAEVHFKEAMEGYRRVLGDDHPSALSSINNVGVLLLRLKKPDEAESYLLEALAGYRRVLGRDHFRTARTMGNLGKLYTDQGRYGEAEATLLEAHGILFGAVGVENRDTQKVISKLADLYDAWDKPDEAGRWRAKLAEG